MIVTPRTKQVSIVVVAVIIAIALAGGFLLFANRLENIPRNYFNADYFNQFSIGSVKVDSGEDGTASGYPAKTVSFTFTEDNSSFGYSENVDASGLTTIGNAAKNANGNAPSLYNMKGATENSLINFNFISSSPADYSDGTYNDSATVFAAIANNNNVTALDFTSKPGEAGIRILTIKVKYTDASGGSSFSTTWNNLINSLKVYPHVTYDVTALAKTGTIHSVFTTTEEQKALTQTNPGFWSNVNAFTAGTKKYDVYKITAATLELSPVIDSNKSTLALTVAKDTDKGTFATDFQQKASTDPDVAYYAPLTTTVTAEGDPAPFLTLYPSNREW